jgi:hypothetical protein
MVGKEWEKCASFINDWIVNILTIGLLKYPMLRIASKQLVLKPTYRLNFVK